ncbi:FAD-dependent oxidoreductase [Methyloligella sp. 2.7D]|uniref:FAD-dependent oxidoreductase n=1 Tax=unclassified Methyloligella TaxID=2625955 RepID=UPI00157D5694|nr:FAD-dependent oxidoreductase [Methyloligella sp. GL2]QKP78625.1 FAD-dependent oxidoreductase [Methyloligella sp. GL2]
MAHEKLSAGCCIVGGGPAGMMLGFLLARAGVDVLVLEKHADFLRDFRGDTIHPSTMEYFYELGMLDCFLAQPHQEVSRLGASIGGELYYVADFSHLPVHSQFVAFMPQWHFLNFLAAEAKRYPNFRLMMETQATDILWDGHRIAGIKARRGEDKLDIRADLVVGADGRHSVVRKAAGFQVDDIGAPMDVLWMRLPKKPGEAQESLGVIGAGTFFVMIDRGDYWQCGYVIPKGGYDALHAKGIAALRESIVALKPDLADRVNVLASWDDVSLLTVKVDRLQRWFRPGLLCIGDAAHAMSPIGGVGINLAVQDAVATANILAEPLRSGPVATRLLEKLQQRREVPAKRTQKLQVLIQNKVITPLLERKTAPKAPFALKLLQWVPPLQRIPARIIGLGFRPEHIRTREALPIKQNGGKVA